MSSKKVTTTVVQQKPKQNKQSRKKTKKAKASAVSGQKTTTVTNVSTTMTTRKPKFVHKTDFVCIDHVEPIGTIIAQDGGNFNIVMDLDMNPGDEKAFPWLSTQAKAWEQYRVKKLNFHFISRTGTLTSGEVVMAPDYDINDQIPGSIEELTQNQDSVSSTAFKDFSCRLQPSALMGGQSRKLVRGYVPRANFDQGRYDLGSFYVALSGISTNPAVYPLTIGRVYVEYSFEFFVPVGNRTAQPITSPILAYANTPNFPTVNLPGGSASVNARPANLVLQGLPGIIAPDSPGNNIFTALEDTVLKVSGLDQYVATSAGSTNVDHYFRKFNPASNAYDIVIGGASTVKSVAINEQIDSTFDFIAPLKKGDKFNHLYDTVGSINTYLGGFSTLNMQDISRNFIA